MKNARAHHEQQIETETSSNPNGTEWIFLVNLYVKLHRDAAEYKNNSDAQNVNRIRPSDVCARVERILSTLDPSIIGYVVSVVRTDFQRMKTEVPRPNPPITVRNGRAMWFPSIIVEVYVIERCPGPNSEYKWCRVTKTNRSHWFLLVRKREKHQSRSFSTIQIAYRLRHSFRVWVCVSNAKWI